ncbi:hypothetical protein quinque_011936 [Culex quinquefasciatus]|uniref:uncharacterized protein LOC119767208 n=1 Tax=Culex quinquefasciatus TaxID=7176 RepID=UPI0018E327D1|nr:uncharacterized protein LOC119767208 [Culex quinquefasciatus]
MYKMWNFGVALVCSLVISAASLESNDLRKHHNQDSHENHDSYEQDHDHGATRKQKRHAGYYQQPLPEVHYDYIQPAYYDHYQPPAYYPPPTYHQKPPCKKHHPTTTTTTTTTPKPHHHLQHHKPLHHPALIPDKALWDKKVELIQDKLEAIHALKDKSVHKVKDVLDQVFFPESRSDPTEVRSEPVEADSRTFLDSKCACEEQIGLLEVSVLQLGDELRKVKSFLAAKEATLLDGTTKIVKVVKVAEEEENL